MNLSNVSRTAILTLIARVVASEKNNVLYNDPMAVLCYERLLAMATEEEKTWITREMRIFGGTQAHHSIDGAKRAKVFDDIATRFIADNPNCTVINLGCGFDTRFWRIAQENCRFIEIDLPEVVALKREIFKDQLGYELIGCSVLDFTWIGQVTKKGNSHFLLLAEGLFPYVSEPDVKQLFQHLTQRFSRSQLILDIIPEKYMQGLWKVLIRLNTKVSWGGLDAPWVFGIKDPRGIESYAPGIKVLGYEKGFGGGPIITVSINAG
jgi:O-methyltransferase involved in polyketide biosynthesis